MYLFLIAKRIMIMARLLEKEREEQRKLLTVGPHGISVGNGLRYVSSRIPIQSEIRSWLVDLWARLNSLENRVSKGDWVVPTAKPLAPS